MFIPVYIFLSVIWFVGLLLAIAWMIYVWILGLTATNLFVLGSLTGLIISPMYPLSVGWFNQKLNVVPPLLAALFCGSALGSLILQKVAGRLFSYRYGFASLFLSIEHLTNRYYNVIYSLTQK